MVSGSAKRPRPGGHRGWGAARRCSTNTRLAALCVLAPLLLAAGNIQVSAEKVDGTSVIHGRVSATVAAPLPAVRQILCSFEQHSEFSRPLRRQQAVTGSTISYLIARDGSEVEIADPIFSQPSAPAPCSGPTYLLAEMAYPWPVEDAWFLTRCESGGTDEHFWLHCKSVAGTHPLNNSRWDVTATTDGTWVQNEYRTDMDRDYMPEFLIRRGTQSRLPDMIEALERMASEVTGRTNNGRN